MIFFLFLPAWAFAVVVGLALLIRRTTRLMGYYVLSISTVGTLFSLVLSTAALLLVGRFGSMFPRDGAIGKVAPFVIIGAYVTSVLVGALLGAIAGAVFVNRIHRRRLATTSVN